MRKFLTILLPALLSLGLLPGFTSCADEEEVGVKNYKIGVSQCSGGDWRDKMNDEMRREAILNPGVSFDFCCADDDPDKQRRDVDSLIDAGVDLLVLAPIDSIHGLEFLTTARKRGVPVIIADRRLTGGKYSAYVGGDNYSVGLRAAEYLGTRLPEGGQILEIRGHDGSSPVSLRHQGFMDGLKNYPKLRVVESVDGWWLRDSAKVRMEDAIHQYPELKGVYCHNDYMAMGAIEMFRWVRKFQREYGDIVPDWTPVFVGVDAVYGYNHGLEWIARGDLDASILYPTGGDVIIKTALKILKGEPYTRDSILNVSVVDVQGAALLNDMDLAVFNEVEKVHYLQRRELSLLKRLDLEQWLLIVTGLLFLVIAISMLQMRRHYFERRRSALHLVRANRQLRDAAHLQLQELQRQQSQPAPAPEQSSVRAKSTKTSVAAPTFDPFIENVYRIIDEHYSEPDFGVEHLSVLLDMSRSQLYRKIKSLTGMTPFDMIRDKRQCVAQELIAKGMPLDKVAKTVGYSSTAYFVKCYEEYQNLAEI